MKIIYYLSNFILRLNLRIQANWNVEGNINVPKNGPLIIVCNHQSNFDPPLVAASVSKRRTWFLAKSELFNGPKIAKMFLRAYGGFPLHKGKSDLSAYKWALKKNAFVNAGFGLPPCIAVLRRPPCPSGYRSCLVDSSCLFFRVKNRC